MTTPANPTPEPDGTPVCDAFFASTLKRKPESVRYFAKSLEKQLSDTRRRLAEVEENLENSKILQREHLQASIAKGKQLTALRNAADGMRGHFAQALRQWRGYAEGDICADHDDPQDLTTADHDEGRVYRAAVKSLERCAALISEGNHPISDSNSPTASRESQG